MPAGDAEAIPYGQAVDDGFTPCPTCRSTEGAPAAEAPATELPTAAPAFDPDPLAEPRPELAAAIPPEPQPLLSAEPAVEPEPAAEPETEAELEPEAELAAEAEPEPAAEQPLAEPEVGADVGAEPEPDVAEPAEPEQPATAPSLGEVWVVPGRPRYHLQGCMIIGDQEAVALPLEQAVDDGFKPCSLCEPD